MGHAGCWAHVRRKFDEALKAQAPKMSSTTGKAGEALTLIKELYRIEKTIKDLPVAEKQKIRQQQAKPILTDMKEWLDRSLTQVTPSSLTGKALTYLSNQWPTLTVYCEDGRLDLDNNAIERAIRPFVICRNNWIFSDTVKGVNASANLYSLIESAKLNGLEPYRYLHYVFNALPKAKTLSDIELLLPWNVDKNAVNQGWKN
ncbi:MAG: IS66 family transposase [Methylococcales bacterium]|nr:IS66 family transposase [Methylococcales bacterium]